MKDNVSNEQFMEWTEKYLNNTIEPETAKQLLDLLRNDPDRLKQFSRQLQLDSLLEDQHAESSADTAEAVLARIADKTTSKVIRPIRWNRILLRTAAVLAVVLGMGAVIKQAHPRKTGEAELYGDLATPTAERSRLDQKMPAVPAQENSARDGRRREVYSTRSRVDPDTGSVMSDERISHEVGYADAVAYHFELVEERVVYPGETAEDIEREYGAPYDPATGRIMIERKVETEAYAALPENDWINTSDKPLSTFSIDVDTASYANVRRFLSNGQMPPADAVRVEEMINYFEYNYASPTGETPFSTAMAVHACPWNPTHKLLRVGLQGRKPVEGTDQPSNLVFLLDVSGSMNSTDKLPLLKKGFAMMVNSLGAQDRVAIVVYAGSTGLVLDSTAASDKETIISAMNRLSAGGSTAGGAGIELAYRVAADHYIKGGINRVILATDGDFNVGTSDLDGLQKLIEEKRETGMFLSVLGFGTGNLKDSTMELLANKGNGNYFYIDSEREADKVLVKQLTANLVTIAKDVKIQVEFNPSVIRSYRLIGYENRMLAAQDFADDRKDAGEIGAGHQVTALYELVTTDAPATQDGVSLKYGSSTERHYGNQDEVLTLKLRYKEPEGSTSKLLTFPMQVTDAAETMDTSFRWATAVAAFGQYLRQSDHLVRYSLDDIRELAESAIGEDPYGYRNEFIQLLQQVKQLEGRTPTESEYPVWQFRN